MLSIANALTFLFLAVIWSKTGWLNVLVKFVLITLALFNAFQVLKHFGYIVKAAL